MTRGFHGGDVAPEYPILVTLKSMRIEGIYCRIGKDPASPDLLLARLLLFDYSLAEGAADYREPWATRPAEDVGRPAC